MSRRLLNPGVLDLLRWVLSGRWPRERDLPFGPDLYARVFDEPKGVMRGWFEDAEDLEDDLAKGGYRVVGDPMVVLMTRRAFKKIVKGKMP